MSIRRRYTIEVEPVPKPIVLRWDQRGKDHSSTFRLSSSGDNDPRIHIGISRLFLGEKIEGRDPWHIRYHGSYD